MNGKQKHVNNMVTNNQDVAHFLFFPNAKLSVFLFFQVKKTILIFNVFLQPYCMYTHTRVCGVDVDSVWGGGTPWAGCQSITGLTEKQTAIHTCGNCRVAS